MEMRQGAQRQLGKRKQRPQQEVAQQDDAIEAEDVQVIAQYVGSISGMQAAEVDQVLSFKLSNYAPPIERVEGETLLTKYKVDTYQHAKILAKADYARKYINKLDELMNDKDQLREAAFASGDDFDRFVANAYQFNDEKQRLIGEEFKDFNYSKHKYIKKAQYMTAIPLAQILSGQYKSQQAMNFYGTNQIQDDTGFPAVGSYLAQQIKAVAYNKKISQVNMLQQGIQSLATPGDAGIYALYKTIAQYNIGQKSVVYDVIPEDAINRFTYTAGMSSIGGLYTTCSPVMSKLTHWLGRGYLMKYFRYGISVSNTTAETMHVMIIPAAENRSRTTAIFSIPLNASATIPPQYYDLDDIVLVLGIHDQTKKYAASLQSTPVTFAQVNLTMASLLECSDQIVKEYNPAERKQKPDITKLNMPRAKGIIGFIRSRDGQVGISSLYDLWVHKVGVYTLDKPHISSQPNLQTLTNAVQVLQKPDSQVWSKRRALAQVVKQLHANPNMMQNAQVQALVLQLKQLVGPQKELSDQQIEGLAKEGVQGAILGSFEQLFDVENKRYNLQDGRLGDLQKRSRMF